MAELEEQPRPETEEEIIARIVEEHLISFRQHYHRTWGPRPRQFFVPYNGKIADITHADVLKHTLTLANAAGTGAIAGETRKIIAIIIESQRIAGTGGLMTYPNEGTRSNYQIWPTDTRWVVIANNTNRLQYALEVANDDFDLYCHGYVVEA